MNRLRGPSNNLSRLLSAGCPLQVTFAAPVAMLSMDWVGPIQLSQSLKEASRKRKLMHKQIATITSFCFP